MTIYCAVCKLLGISSTLVYDSLSDEYTCKTCKQVRVKIIKLDDELFPLKHCPDTFCESLMEYDKKNNSLCCPVCGYAMDYIKDEE